MREGQRAARVRGASASMPNLGYQNLYKCPRRFSLKTAKWSSRPDGLRVMISVSHTEGSGFETRSGQALFASYVALIAFCAFQ